MSKKPAFIEIENFLIKRSLIQSVQVRKDYYDNKYLAITYNNGQEIKTYQTNTHTNEYIEKKYNEIKEMLL